MYYEGNLNGIPKQDFAFASDDNALDFPIATSTPGDITPATLNNIEQTFMELQHMPSTSAYQPEVHVKVENTSNDSSYGAESPRDNFHVPNIDPVTYLVPNSRRPTGPRKPKPVIINCREDAERLAQRRERNRLAAAKCRQKRDTHTMRLVRQTEQLEEEQAGLENEIFTLQQQKQELEMLLQNHLVLSSTGCNMQLQQQQPMATTGLLMNTIPCTMPMYNSMPSTTTQVNSTSYTQSFPGYQNQRNYFSYGNTSDNMFYHNSGNISFGNNQLMTGFDLPVTTSCSTQMRNSSDHSDHSGSPLSPRALC